MAVPSTCMCHRRHLMTSPAELVGTASKLRARLALKRRHEASGGDAAPAVAPPKKSPASTVPRPHPPPPPPPPKKLKTGDGTAAKEEKAAAPATATSAADETEDEDAKDTDAGEGAAKPTPPPRPPPLRLAQPTKQSRKPKPLFQGRSEVTNREERESIVRAGAALCTARSMDSRDRIAAVEFLDIEDAAPQWELKVAYLAPVGDAAIRPMRHVVLALPTAKLLEFMRFPLGIARFITAWVSPTLQTKSECAFAKDGPFSEELCAVFGAIPTSIDIRSKEAGDKPDDLDFVEEEIGGAPGQLKYAYTDVSTALALVYAADRKTAPLSQSQMSCLPAAVQWKSAPKGKARAHRERKEALARAARALFLLQAEWSSVVHVGGCDHLYNEDSEVWMDRAVMFQDKRNLELFRRYIKESMAPEEQTASTPAAASGAAVDDEDAPKADEKKDKPDEDPKPAPAVGVPDADADGDGDATMADAAADDDDEETKAEKKKKKKKKDKKKRNRLQSLADEDDS